MEKTDVLVIGGGPAGIITAITAKNNNAQKSVTIIKKHAKSMVPCGIPYIFGTLNDVSKNMMGDAPLEAAQVKILVNEVIKIIPSEKKVLFKDQSEMEYDRLVIASGSKTLKPAWLEGQDKKGVYYVEKNMDYLSDMFESLKTKNEIIVVGGGFIGVEMSDELVKTGKKVTVIEKTPHILMAAFDPDVAEKAENVLKERGVNVRCGIGIKKILGKETASGVELENGEIINADAVILAMGYTPDNSLAVDAGLDLNKYGFIKVDEYMRTSANSIFAVGDCAEKRDFITKKPNKIMLASTATTEARVAGMNLFKISAEKSFSGTISIFDTRLGVYGFGVAGVTESIAKNEHMDYIAGEFEGVDRHPGTIPDSGKQYVKLIALKETGTIIGAEVSGAASSAEITNLIGFVIQNRMTIFSIITSQIGTHPLLTSAPTNYPLIKAAEIILKKMRACYH